jgi:hypothetical protein
MPHPRSWRSTRSSSGSTAPTPRGAKSLPPHSSYRRLTRRETWWTGYCTIIYLFNTGWRKACEAHAKDVLAEIVPGVIARLREMTRSVAPSAIPTMAAMMTAAAIEASPNLWRAQYGDWRPEELPALQATAVLLAEWVNNAHEDHDAALRVIIDTLAKAEEDTDAP